MGNYPETSSNIVKQSVAATNLDIDYTTNMVSHTLENKTYRDILEACRQPITARAVRASVARKVTIDKFFDKLNRMTRAGLLTKINTPKQPGIRSHIKYHITPSGERLLKQKPGARPLVQYIIFGFDRE